MILTGRPDTRLSSEAHERVHAAAAQLGYRPNIAARALRTDKTRTIAFISDYVATTRFASGLIRGALEERLVARTSWANDPLWKALEPMDFPPDSPTDLAARHDDYLYELLEEEHGQGRR